MTEQERLELLKAVAEVAPEGMGAELCPDIHGVPFFVCFDNLPRSVDEPEDERVVLYLGDGECRAEDSEACFAMLDAMEGAGWKYHVWDRCPPGDRYWLSMAHETDPKDERRINVGPLQTRAEAIARAFVQVFRAKVGGRK